MKGRWFPPAFIWLSLPTHLKGGIAVTLFRSDLHHNILHGLTVLNSPGTVDADYRGEIRVILVNLSNEPFTIEPGERVAQMVFARHETAQWEPAETLDETERGAGGFGSTGTK